MTTVPALRSASLPSAPSLETARFRWLITERPGPSHDLPSVEEEAAIRREIRAALVPVLPDDLRPMIGQLLASFPQRVERDLRPYMQALVQHLAEFPQDVIAAACGRAVRERKFLPAVAELVADCEAGVKDRRSALRNLARVALERERRQREADERERYARDRADMARREALAKERLAEMLPGQDVEAVWAGLAALEWLAVLAAAKQGNDALDAALRALPVVARAAGQT